MVDLLAQGTILQGRNGQYRILSIIGRGGMGAVYRGERISDNAIWAVKEMRPAQDSSAEEIADSRRLFAQEAEMLSHLQHPNLPQVIDYFEQGGKPYLVMEYVQGKALEEKQRENNAPFFQRDVINWGVQIARVLHYLHTRTPAIIFRDMKPPNVMLTPEGVIKLIDFGVARTYKASKSKDTVAMGSAGYAPPEQYGKGQTDARADVYALGATLMHLLTNLPPVPLQTPKPGSLRKHNQSISPQMEAVIIKAMDLDPNQRFQSMSEFEQALIACADGPINLPGVAQARMPVAPTIAPGYAPPIVPVMPPTPRPADPTIAPGYAAAPAAAPAASAVAPAWTPPPEPGGLACDQCGKVNKLNARFCSGCGARIKHQTPKLVITSPRAAWEMTLNQMPCRIGRRDPVQNHHPEIDLAEHDRGIASRRHAVIQQDGERYQLIDQGSVNGTSINGIPMTAYQPHTLRPGDRIRIGDVEMVFSMD